MGQNTIYRSNQSKINACANNSNFSNVILGDSKKFNECNPSNGILQISNEHEKQMNTKHKNTNITEKADVPAEGTHDGRSYSDEKLIEIIDQSLEMMDKDYDGYVSFPEFVATQESLRKANGP